MNKEVLRFIKFGLFSASAGIIEIVSFTLLKEFTPSPDWLSYLIGLVLSVLWNFTLNRKFTFRSVANVPRALFLVAHWLTDGAHWNGYLVTAMNMILNFVTEFLYQKYVVYGKTVDSALKPVDKNL